MVVGMRDDLDPRALDAELRERFRTAADEMPLTPAWTTRGRIAVAVGASLVLLSLDGTVRAVAPLGMSAATSPAVADDGTIRIATLEGTLVAFDEDGHARGRAQLGERAAVTGALAIGRDGGVRAATRANALVCVGPGGTERWRYAVDDSFTTGVALDREDTSVAVTTRGRMLAISRDGALLWQVDVDDRTEAPPVLGADGTIYVTSRRGLVQAWR